MRYVYSLDGSSTPHVKKYDIGGTVSYAGILLEASNSNEAGLTPGTTTTAADCVGLGLDTATYVTAQQTDGTSAQRKVSVVINGDAIYAALMSGGATEGTALSLYPVTTASADGLNVTTGTSWTSTEFDEGSVWGYDGANAGAYRKITTSSSTAATVTVAFDQDTVIGDNFLRCPWWAPCDTTSDTIQFTTNLYQADASIAVGTGLQSVIVELVLNSLANNGRTNSWVYFTTQDMVWTTPTTI